MDHDVTARQRHFERVCLWCLETLLTNQSLEGFDESWEFVDHGQPYQLVVNLVIEVCQDVSLGYPLMNLGELSIDFRLVLAYPAQSLADDLQASFHRRPEPFIGCVRFWAYPFRARLDEASGMECITQPLS